MYLGIDIGTSAVKAVLIDAEGVLADQSSVALPVLRPQPLWSEQNPADWWSATQAAVGALRADLRRAVRAVGLSGQMHGATLLDERQRVLRPAILWNDGRSGAECAELERLVPRLAEITGNRAMPGFTAPKLLWVRAHEPASFAATAVVLLPKDYVRLRMTGEIASDLSDSAGTLWLDVGRRAWSPEMLAATGLPESAMPRVYEGNEITGQLRAEVADAWGMRPVPVVGGGGDNAAGGVGMGVVRDGEAFLSLGTSGVLFVATQDFRPNPAQGVHTFCHAVPQRWHQMAVILSAASCMEWAARAFNFGSAGDLFDSVEARNRPADSEVFLPYLSGERTPHNDPHAQGMFFGLTHETSSASLGQAVMEGVAFALRDGLDALIESGTAIGSIAVIGGGARSTYWGTVLSTILERPLTYRDSGTLGPAYGAARLAWMADIDARVDDSCIAPALLRIVEPDARQIPQYRATHARYRQLYRRVKDLFHVHTSLGETRT